jgi:hypothetical protein
MSAQSYDQIERYLEKMDKIVDDLHSIRTDLEVNNQTLSAMLRTLNVEMLELKKKSEINSNRLAILESASFRAQGWADIAKVAWIGLGAGFAALVSWLINQMGVHR